MIWEDPDATIGNCVGLLRDLENIEHQVNEEDMGNRKGVPNLTDEQKRRIINLAKQKVSVSKIAQIMGVSNNAIYMTCRGENRSIRHLKNSAPVEKAALKAREKKGFVRPAAVYSNSSPYGIASAYNNQTTTP